MNRIHLINELYQSGNPKRTVELTNMLLANRRPVFLNEAEHLELVKCIPDQDREEIVPLAASIFKASSDFALYEQWKVIDFLQRLPQDKRKDVASQITELLQKEPGKIFKESIVYFLLYYRGATAMDFFSLLSKVDSLDVIKTIVDRAGNSPHYVLTFLLTKLLIEPNLTKEKYKESCDLLDKLCRSNRLLPIAKDYWKSFSSLDAAFFDLESFLKDLTDELHLGQAPNFVRTFVEIAELHREFGEGVKASFSNVRFIFELLPKRSPKESCDQLVSFMNFLQESGHCQPLALTLEGGWQANEKEEILSFAQNFCDKFPNESLEDLPELLLHLLTIPYEHRKAVVPLIMALNNSRDSLRQLKVIIKAEKNLDFETILILGECLILRPGAKPLCDYFDHALIFDAAVALVCKEDNKVKLHSIILYFNEIKKQFPFFNSFNLLHILLEEIPDEKEIPNLLKQAQFILSFWPDDEDLSSFFLKLILELRRLSIEERENRKEETCKFLLTSKEFPTKSLITPYLSVCFFTNPRIFSEEEICLFQQAQSLSKIWKPSPFSSVFFAHLIDTLFKIPQEERLSRIDQMLFRFARASVLDREFSSYVNGTLEVTPETTISLLSDGSAFSYPDFTWEIDTVLMDREPQKILLQLGKLVWIYDELPNLNYKDSPAYNQGGITRDMIARLFKALRFADRAHLPFKEVAEEKNALLLPQLKDPSLLNKEELGLLMAIGKVFGCAMLNREDIVTGVHFHPLLFKLFCALSKEDLSQMAPFDELIYDPMNSFIFNQSNFIPEDAFNTLLKVYLQEEYPSMFGADLEQRKKNIVLFVEKNVIPEEMKAGGIESKEDFLNTYQIPHTLLAVSCIAKTCYDVFLNDENEFKKFSHLALSIAIQGGLDREKILDSCEWEGRLEYFEETNARLINWLVDATDEDVALLVQSISGNPALPEGVTLFIRLFIPDDLNTFPTFNTCSFTMNLPTCYPDYETFKSKLDLAIASSKDPAGGFDFS